MKKKIAVIAIAAIAVAAVVAPSLANWDMDGRHAPKQKNIVCPQCDGTGRSWGPGGKGTGSSKCWNCKGSGWWGGY